MMKGLAMRFFGGAMTQAAAYVMGICCILSLGGCKEKDVPYIIDSEEIETYIKQSEDARNLFRFEGLVQSGTYSLVPGGPTYTDTVLSSGRSYDVWVSDNALDMGSYGRVRVAHAIVTDEFTIRTTRRQGSDSNVTQQTRSMERVGVFWKLGSDAEPYVGWLLWGFGGRPSTSAAVTIETVAGQFRLDTLAKYNVENLEGYKYIRIREGLPATIPGDQLGVVLSPAPRLRPLISSVTEAGYFSAPVPPTDSGRFATTVQLPVVYDRLFDVAMIQFVNDSLGTVSANPVFIPYKILH